MSKRLKPGLKRSIPASGVPSDYLSCADCQDTAKKVAEIARGLDCRFKSELVLAELAAKMVAEAEGPAVKPPRGTLYFELLCRRRRGETGRRLVEALWPAGGELTGQARRALLEISRLDLPHHPREDLLGLVYMSLTNGNLRKKAGNYYTASWLVERLVESTLAEHGRRGRLAVVDPCCGSGNFLLKSFYFLKGLYESEGAPPQKAARQAADSLYGGDIDPLAACLARINLYLAAGLGPDADALFSRIQARCSLEHKWQKGGFDIVIGNPPWGSPLAAHRLESLKADYLTAASGESFALFIELGLKLLRPGGVLAYVLPRSLLGVQLHAPIRRLLLAETRIEFIELCSNSFASVFAPALLLKAIKEPAPGGHRLTVITGTSKHQVAQKRFETNEQAVFNVSATAAEQSILEKMKNIPGSMFLRDGAAFALGIVTGSNKRFLLENPGPGREMILRGSNIFKYNFSPSPAYILFRPAEFQQAAPVEMYRAPEKLIYRFINKQLVFAYDDQQTLSLNSANIVIPKLPGCGVKYVAAVLNSRAAQFFFEKTFSSVKVLRQHLEAIPIPPCSAAIQAQITALVDAVLGCSCRRRRLLLYNKIDGIISSLFHLDGEETRLIKAQGRDLLLGGD